MTIDAITPTHADTGFVIAHVLAAESRSSAAKPLFSLQVAVGRTSCDRRRFDVLRVHAERSASSRGGGSWSARVSDSIDQLSDALMDASGSNVTQFRPAALLRYSSAS